MPNTPPNLMAGGNISPSRFVMMDTDPNQCIQATDNAETIGVTHDSTNYAPLSDQTVSEYAAKDGQNVRLFGDGDVCLITAAEALSVGDEVKADGDGKAQAIATTGTTNQQVAAVMLEAASAEDVLAKCYLIKKVIRPALT